MPTLWKKVLADFWSNKTRTFLMVLTVTLGVFSIGFVGNGGAMMKRDMDADFNASNPAHAQIFVKSFDENWLRALAKVPGVKNVEGRVRTSAQLLKANGEKINIRFEAPKSFDSIRVNMLKPADPLEGVIPTLGRKEVLLDRSAAADFPYQPGDVIEVELFGGKKRALTFKGYVHDVTTFPYAMVGTVTAYVTRDTMPWVGVSEDYNELLVSVAEDATDTQHVTNVAHEITERFRKGDNPMDAQVSIYNPGHHFGWQVTQGVIFILATLGWLTVLLSAFLIINTVVALMSQHIRQIGIMKAVGGGNGQIFLMYVALFLIFGLVALIISIPLAAWASYQVSGFLAGFLNYERGPFLIDPSVVMMQTILAFSVPLVAALAPLWTGLRVPVREALSDYGIGSGPMRQMRENVHLDFFPRPVLISLRNTMRKKARLTLTLFALVLGGAVFIAVFNLWQSFDQTMQEVQGYFLADINLSFTGLHQFDEVKTIALSDPDVLDAEGWTTANAEVMSADGKTSNEVLFVAPPSTSTLIKPIMTEGRWLSPLDTNAVVVGNHLLAIRPDLKVGDWITINLRNEKKQWQIVGIYRMPGNVSPPLIYTNYEYISQLLHQRGKVYSLRITTSQHDAATQQYTAIQLQDIFKRKNVSVGGITQGAVWMQQQKSQTDVLVYFMMVMAILIASVGGLGLMGMMSINVMERTREIGVMRAIGAADLDIQLIVIAEGLVVGLASWLMAIGLSFPITYLLDYGVGVSIFQAPLTPLFNWGGTWVWLAGILVISLLASAIPAWRASRLTVRDTLVYE